LFEAPLDLEALGLSLYSLQVNPALQTCLFKNDIGDLTHNVGYPTLGMQHRQIQDFFYGRAQGRVHPDVYSLHSSEDLNAQVMFYNKHG